MRYAIVSDIHANLQAWHAVRDDLRECGVDEVLCLGDVIGYGPRPVQVLDEVREFCGNFVLGNHDAVVAGKLDPNLFNDNAKYLIDWTCKQLGDEPARFFNEVPMVMGDDIMTCVHAEAAIPERWTYIVEPEQSRESFEATDAQVTFVGHTHVPLVCRYDIHTMAIDGRSGLDFAFEPKMRYLVNVGSVGDPRDGTASASYCIYDSEAQKVFFRSLPFDYDAFREDLAKSRLPVKPHFLIVLGDPKQATKKPVRGDMALAKDHKERRKVKPTTDSVKIKIKPLPKRKIRRDAASTSHSAINTQKRMGPRRPQSEVDIPTGVIRDHDKKPSAALIASIIVLCLAVVAGIWLLLTPPKKPTPNVATAGGAQTPAVSVEVEQVPAGQQRTDQLATGGSAGTPPPSPEPEPVAAPPPRQQPTGPHVSDAIAYCDFDKLVDGKYMSGANSLSGSGRLKRVAGIGGQGQAVDFDGKSVLRIDNTNDLHAETITVMAWVKLPKNVNQKTWAGIVSKGQKPWRLSLGDRGHGFHFAVNEKGDISRTDEKRDIYRDDKWHHVAGTFDMKAKKVCLYIDGTLHTEGDTKGKPMGRNDKPFAIGAGAELADRELIGSIDEVLVVPRSMSASEIKAIFEAKKPIVTTTAVAPAPPTPSTLGEWAGVFWVWDSPDGVETTKGGKTRFFRIPFELTEKPMSASLVMSVDDEHTTYVNGHKIGSDGTWDTIDSYAITNLVVGRNVIAISANNGQREAGAIARLTVKTTKGEQVFGTGMDTLMQVENDDRGWQNTNFNDSNWRKAVVIGDATVSPWKLVDKETPPPKKPPPPPKPVDPMIAVRTTVARLVLQNKLKEALAVSEPSPEMKKQITEIGRAPRRIMASFIADKGKLVEIELKSGKTMFYIIKVSPTSVEGKKRVAGGSISSSFGFDDLAVAEKIKRLGNPDDPGNAIYVGLLAYQARKPSTAQRFFERAKTPFAEELIRQMNMADADRREAQAEADFKKLLGLAKVSVSDYQPKRIADEMRKATYSAAQKKDIRESAVRYAQLHASSNFMTENRRTVGRLIGLIQDQAVDILPTLPEAADYTLIYDLDLKNLSHDPAYTTDKSNAPGAFDRIAYLLELKAKNESVEFVYVSMDAFTDDLKKVGVPGSASKAVFQQNVDNLTVVSNVEGVTNGSGMSGGNIEFWASNYGDTNTANVPNADDKAFDWGDSGGDSKAGHGCMQVHNHEAKHTIFGISEFRKDSGIGIGNGPGHPDWTFAKNRDNYLYKRLRVLVRFQ
jgi:predicted phosphodiesterase